MLLFFKECFAFKFLLKNIKKLLEKMRYLYKFEMKNISFIENLIFFVLIVNYLIFIFEKYSFGKAKILKLSFYCIKHLKRILLGNF